MKEKILDYLRTEYAQKIIKEQEFFFQKGHDAMRKWLNYQTSDIVKDELLSIANNYDEIQKRSISNTEIKDIVNLLFEITSYCDTKSKDKNFHNQYDDNRTLAMAYVRMNHWFEKLILFKFNRVLVSKGSPLNAFNYLLDPENNATILSENHREMISKKILDKAYNPSNFIEELKDYFSSFNITTFNTSNYTYLLSCIIYSIKKDWLDDIVGLMASDNTDWKDYLINDMGEDNPAILWNSKRPTGTNDTIKMLRNKINDGEYFKLFYSVHGSVQYVAEIIDFAENDIELKKKNWPSTFKEITWYKPDFIKYKDKDGSKSARIVFLAKKFNKIKPIAANEFEVYKKYSYPVHDNLAPIVSEPDLTIIPPTITITATATSMIENNSNPLNQILFGPPGTGKTFKLQQIIKQWGLRSNKSSEKDYTAFVKDFTWWKIIALALLDNEKSNVPDLAKHPLIIAKLGISNIKSLKTRLWSSLQHHCVDHCENVKLAKRIGERVFYKESNSEWRLDDSVAFRLEYNPLIEAYEDFKVSENIESRDYTFTTCHQSLTYEDFIEGIKPELNNIDEDEVKGNEVVYEIRKGIFYNACEKAVQKAGFVNLKDCLDKTKEKRKELFDIAIAENKIHVIFLDEINRCNVSSVFGELITLIEEDKRLGKENEIADIILPYSQEEFGVPSNLYIIGTMNTADRSVDALDTALRRRFSFEEMPPKYNLVGLQNSIYNFQAFEIIETINKRIEKLLDRDHTIGHSYFLNKNEDSLIDTFYRCVIPLLQEYFFGDYEKIGLILGKGFVELDKSTDTTDVFADFDSESAQDYSDKSIYRIIDHKNNKEAFSMALSQLMNKKVEKA